jgi:hypothetical protein
MFKLGSALIAVLALTAIAASTASAAETLWKWVPGAEKAAFTATSGKAKLEGVNKAKITCESSSVLAGEGKLTKEQTLGEAMIHFKGCTALGFPINSLGDDNESGVILVHVDLHNCIIASAPTLRAGILFTLTEVHLDIPALGGLLIIVKGSFVAEVSSELKKAKLTHTLAIKQTGGKQAVEKCEGGSKDTLLAKTDAEAAFLESGEEAEKAEVTFTIAQEAMA